MRITNGIPETIEMAKMHFVFSFFTTNDNKENP